MPARKPKPMPISKKHTDKLRDAIGRREPKLPTPPMRKPGDKVIGINPPKKGAGPKRPAGAKKAAPGSAVRKKRGY